jgi:hypothetical protein
MRIVKKLSVFQLPLLRTKTLDASLSTSQPSTAFGMIQVDIFARKLDILTDCPWVSPLFPGCYLEVAHLFRCFSLYCLLKTIIGHHIILTTESVVR